MTEHGETAGDGTGEDEESVEGDDASDERRLFGDRRPETAAAIASELGVTRVALAADRIGRFSLAHRCTATSIAAGDELVVGTDEAVCIQRGEEFVATGFGPAVAVGVHEGTPRAAAADGTVARYDDGEWRSPGSVEEPRRFDGHLLAAGDGVYRIDENLTTLGLDSVRDISREYAATADGLYRREDGAWTRESARDCSLVVGDGESAFAVSDGTLLERIAGEWETAAAPIEGAIADVARGESLYAVTESGTMYVLVDAAVTSDGQGGWRSRALGVRGAVEVALV